MLMSRDQEVAAVRPGALDLMVDLHAEGDRQGPGSADHTTRALRLAGLLDQPGPLPHLRVADLGSGTGAASLVLAQTLGADVVAVDLVPRFLTILQRRAAAAGVGGSIRPVVADLARLPLPKASFDVLWSEGAIYTVGFEEGVRRWCALLKPGGLLGVTELTWFTRSRPTEIERYWDREYPQVDTAAAKFAVLERHGLTPVGYFPLPTSCWLEQYYQPLQRRFPAFLQRHGHSAAAQALVTSEQAEIDLYHRYQDVVGYGFYLAQRRGPQQAGTAAT